MWTFVGTWSCGTCLVMFTFWTFFGKIDQSTCSDDGYWCYLSRSLSPIDLVYNLIHFDKYRQYGTNTPNNILNISIIPQSFLVLLSVNPWPHAPPPIGNQRWFYLDMIGCEYHIRILKVKSFLSNVLVSIRGWGPLRWLQVCKWWLWSGETTQKEGPVVLVQFTFL